MKKINLGGSGLLASEIALGCMRMHALDCTEAARVIETAHNCGINFFDHADIYGAGKSEETFREAFRKTSLTREEIFIQSKCGIDLNGGVRYDSSKEYLLKSVDGILARLGTDYLDVLAIHRPDALCEPEEIAEAFHTLHQAGKVRRFGVSNYNTMQLKLLSRYTAQKLIVNQLQFSPAHTGMIDCGIQTNMKTEGAVQRDGMVLDYCRLENITIQAWSPLQTNGTHGFVFAQEAFSALHETLQSTAEEYGITAPAAIIAWILRHPAKIQPIIGSMNPKHIEEMCAASEAHLTRRQWYDIYASAGNLMP